MDRTLLKALEKYGEEMQQAVAVGEIGELLALFGKQAQGRASQNDWIDEIADATICLRILAIIHGALQVDARVDAKLDRLERQLEETECLSLMDKIIGEEMPV